VLLPFGSPPLRAMPLRPRTSMPPIVRHCFVCLLDYFTFLTCPFCIPNTSIYISFRAAQDHDKAAGRDTTSSMTSSTLCEDPVATTWCHSRSLLSLAIVLVFISLVVNYIVVELVLLLLVVNYIVDLIICV
jgi:hypothetical protein